MSAATLFLLFALVHGPNDAVNLTQLASYTDMAACEAAAKAVQADLGKDGQPSIDIGCLSTDQLLPLLH